MSRATIGSPGVGRVALLAAVVPPILARDPRLAVSSERLAQAGFPHTAPGV